MTKASQNHKALVAIRGTLRGWAFAPDDWIPRMVHSAEAQRDALPTEELRTLATALIEPVRARLGPQGK